MTRKFPSSAVDHSLAAKYLTKANRFLAPNVPTQRERAGHPRVEQISQRHEITVTCHENEGIHTSLESTRCDIQSHSCASSAAFCCGAGRLYEELKFWSVVHCPLQNTSALESVLVWFDEALTSKQY
jgi:hypothetical protein